MKYIIGVLLLIGALVYFDDQMFDVADIDCLMEPKVMVCQFNASDYTIADRFAWATLIIEEYKGSSVERKNK